MALATAYQEWRPRYGISAESIAAAHSVTKCSMYAMLRREGIPLKTGKHSQRAEPPLADVSRVMVEILLDQLTDLKIEQRGLQAENIELRGQLVAKGL